MHVPPFKQGTLWASQYRIGCVVGETEGGEVEAGGCVVAACVVAGAAAYVAVGKIRASTLVKPALVRRADAEFENACKKDCA